MTLYIQLTALYWLTNWQQPRQLHTKAQPMIVLHTWGCCWYCWTGRLYGWWWNWYWLYSVELWNHANKYDNLCGRPPQYVPAPCKLTFDLLTLKVVSESRVTWAASVPISVLVLCSRLRPDVRDTHHRLMPPPRGRGHNNMWTYLHCRLLFVSLSWVFSSGPFQFQNYHSPLRTIIFLWHVTLAWVRLCTRMIEVLA